MSLLTCYSPHFDMFQLLSSALTADVPVVVFLSVSVPAYGVQNNLVSTSSAVLSPTGTHTPIGKTVIFSQYEDRFTLISADSVSVVIKPLQIS